MNNEIGFLRIRNRALEQEVLELKRREYADVNRVILWAKNPNREPAETAFTAGNERNLAREIESLLKGN